MPTLNPLNYIEIGALIASAIIGLFLYLFLRSVDEGADEDRWFNNADGNTKNN